MNERIGMRWLAVLVTGFIAWPASSNTLSSLEEECERQWIAVSGAAQKPGLSEVSPALLRQWSAKVSECGTTAVFWGRLAMVQLLANDLTGAKESLSKAPVSDPVFGYVVDMATVQIGVQERMLSPAPITAEDVAKFESAYAGVVAKHPNWPTGYAMLGGTQTMLGKHFEAIRNLERAAKGDAYQLWGVYRNQTISFSEIGKHQEALAAADRAAAMNSSVLSDPSFVYSVAISHAALGYLDDADDALRVIASRRPETRNDPGFRRAHEYCRSQRSRLERR